METSKVYFTNLRTTPSSNLLDKMERLVKRAGIANIDFQNQFVAIKIHFGEPGNLAFIRPNYAARMATLLRNLGAKPFLTDCNTLYSGRRANAVDHLESAMENGFNPISAKCDVIIADGLKGTEYREIEIDGEYCKAPKIGSAIADADIIISMNHFKGHEQTGFGGALKNLGMGCASVGGKLELHSASQPRIDIESCKGCNICVKHCRHDAIHLNASHKAEIDYGKCVGCGQCVALCQYDGAVMGEGDTSERLNYKIAEYTKAVLSGKPNFHISFIMNVSPECDCWNHNDAAIVPDLGIAASFDPVALDKACADMVIKAPILETGNRLSDAPHHEHLEGCDKFHLMHPDTNWQAGLEHAEKIGLGTQEYDRRAVFDVYCENEKGEKFLVEMQRGEQQFFKDRSVFYSTFPIREQAKRGEWDYELKAVYVVGILNFSFDNSDEEYFHHEVKLVDLYTHKVFYDKLTFVYLEMPKFNKTEDELESMFDKWLFVLRNLASLLERPRALQNRVFDRLFETAEIAKFTKTELSEYWDSLKNFRDWYSVISTAEKKGREEGREEEKRENARNFKKLGITIDVISQATGLSKEEIEKL